MKKIFVKIKLMNNLINSFDQSNTIMIILYLRNAYFREQPISKSIGNILNDGKTQKQFVMGTKHNHLFLTSVSQT